MVSFLRHYTTTSFPIIKHPHARELKFKETLCNNLFLDRIPSLQERQELPQKIIFLNKHRPFHKLLVKKPWDIKSYDQENLPVIIGEIEHKKHFSERYGRKFFLFMDMPIRMPGEGWKIPKELKQFEEMIEKAARFERLINPDFNEHYVYLTVDQREVPPGESQRRIGWHADSFGHADSIYLASDKLPTRFSPGPFPFKGLDPNNTEDVLNLFKYLSRNYPIVEYPNYTITRMGPECIHDVALNKIDTLVRRTFVKITFSKQILNREGNGHNALFDYNWPMVPRSDTQRNHASVSLDYGPPTADTYSPLSKKELRKLFVSGYDTAYKINRVEAHPATPGELLQTESSGFRTTVNQARANDWKITAGNSQYFLPLKIFEDIYELAEDGTYSAKKRPLPYVEVEQPTVIEAPWGSKQYLRKGDFLVKRSENDIYGVLKEDFENNYAN